eukprot:GHVS01049953.1.p1 GENE.GHVS01049953.1~~GHVS01049953.1.p1  ORF type:complete len:196 (-),score=35.72 GHVS01049953.1:86-673(-)
MKFLTEAFRCLSFVCCQQTNKLLLPSVCSSLRAFSSSKAVCCLAENKTVGNIMNLAIQKFKANKVYEPEASAQWLMAHCLGRGRMRPSREMLSREMTNEQIGCFDKFCARRNSGEPVQLVVGEWDFRGHTLKMCAGVFIPRPETEELVELLLEHVVTNSSADNRQPLRILEVGVGTGAIGLALLAELPYAQCVGI